MHNDIVYRCMCIPFTYVHLSFVKKKRCKIDLLLCTAVQANENGGRTLNEFLMAGHIHHDLYLQHMEVRQADASKKLEMLRLSPNSTSQIGLIPHGIAGSQQRLSSPRSAGQRLPNTRAIRTRVIPHARRAHALNRPHVFCIPCSLMSAASIPIYVHAHTEHRRQLENSEDSALTSYGVLPLLLLLLDQEERQTE